MLWALMFISAYPRNENEMCTLLGDTNPYTIKKLVWPFIEGVAGLSDSVVSF